MANKNIKKEIHIISYREIRIKTLRRYLFIPTRVAIIFLKKKISFGKDVENLNLHTLLTGV